LVIKRLLEAGFRLGHVVAKTVIENFKIAADLNLLKPEVKRSDSTNALISLLGHPYSEAFKALPPVNAMSLLMVETVMAEAGAYIMNVGADIPMISLRLAATDCEADVLLTFIFSYPLRAVVPTLAHLRRLLPQRMLIWAGGASLSQDKRAPKGVRIISHFDEAITALGQLVRAGQLR
jgi:hypothetical protein